MDLHKVEERKSGCGSNSTQLPTSGLKIAAENLLRKWHPHKIPVLQVSVRFQQGTETTSMTFLLAFGNLYFSSKPKSGSSVLAKQVKEIVLKVLQLEAIVGIVLLTCKCLSLLLMMPNHWKGNTLSSLVCSKNIPNNSSVVQWNLNITKNKVYSILTMFLFGLGTQS